ncbi:MAG: helix-turn-helix transcriptional regulator [Solimonas sp.]
MRQQVAQLQKASASHRRQIAALKKQLTAQERELAKLRRSAGKAPAAEQPAEGRKVRYVAKGLKPLRTRLGISARDFGLLVGVTEQAVYNWEARKATPRAAQIEKIAALRGIGKKEARARLEQLAAEAT